MCGIIGYVGHRKVAPVLIKGLKRLEYRGYDSAGIAYFKSGKIQIRKSEGKIANVERLINGDASALSEDVLQCGIGHTRWATHGGPTTQNAHPHRTGHVTLVHNGIIENYEKIREEVVKKGHRPQSETDSELFGFLVLEEMTSGTPFVEAVRRSFKRLEGACSVVVMSEQAPGVIVGIRNGSPLVSAVDPQGGVIFASDAQAILDYAKDVYFLENGDMVVGDSTGLRFFSFETGKTLQRESTHIDWSADALDKQGYPHYMLKEIFEQPHSMVDTINGLLDRARIDPFPLVQGPGVDILNKAEEMIIVACGTSWHAALLGKYWLERWAGMQVNVELASEFRYRDPVVKRNSVLVGISQSGETADTLAVIREMRRRGMPTLAVTNVRGSTMTREADATFFLSAGPEIGVAATKTFMCQILTLFLWAGYLGLPKGKDNAAKIQKLFDDLLKLPHALETVLRADTPWVNHIREVAKNVAGTHGFFFIGRGYSFPMALEGALKVKEIAYIHAEGYAAGELKHGPIAMLDQDMVVVVLAPEDHWIDKTISNLQEVKARGARILGIGDDRNSALKAQCHEWIPVPALGKHEWDESLYPFLIAPALQLLSYEVAVLRGTDVDQPRNLAKSVTVE